MAPGTECSTNTYTAVKLVTSDDGPHAFVEIRSPEAFIHEDTEDDALFQLINAIQQAATSLNNAHTCMHLHCIASAHQHTQRYNVTTDHKYVGQHPSYEQLIQVTHQLTLQIDTIMEQHPYNTYYIHQVYAHLSY